MRNIDRPIKPLVMSSQRAPRAPQRPLFFLLGLAAVVLTMVSASPPSQFADVRGLYARVGVTERSLPDSVLNNSSIDGIALYSNWDAVEPQEGQFDWSWIDSALSRAAAHHKKMSLSITAGVYTPDWVYADGGKDFDYVWKEHWGFSACSRHRMPVPWDPIFERKWTDLIAAFGARYDGSSDVVLVHITGVNSSTDETLLPISRGGTVSGQFGLVTCQADDEVKHWQQVGYTRKKLENVWLAIATAFSKAFPHKIIAPNVGPGWFPPIDDDSNVQSQRVDYRVTTDLIAIGSQAFGPQFGVQNNGLSASWTYEEVSKHASAMVTGYQMLTPATNDRHCHLTQHTPCTPHDELQASLDAGIGAGAQYIELILPDALNPNVQDVLADAHSKLARVAR